LIKLAKATLSFCLLVSLSAAMPVVSSQTHKSDSSPSTVLQFPRYSLGTLTIDAPQIDGHAVIVHLFEKKPFNQAAGKVTVAGDGKILLRVNYATAEKPDQLLNCPDHIYALDLSKLPIEDAGLKNIEHLHNLYFLNLENTDISDAAFSSIVKLKNLHELCLASTLITPAGVARLKELPALQELNISSNNLNDSCISALSNLRNLKNLSIKRTNISNTALAYLKKLQELAHLDVAFNSGINADAVSDLKLLKNLRTLRIADTGVKPDDAAAFRQVRSLHEIEIGWTNTSQATIANWRHNLPNINVKVYGNRTFRVPAELFNPKSYATPAVSKPIVTTPIVPKPIAPK